MNDRRLGDVTSGLLRRPVLLADRHHHIVDVVDDDSAHHDLVAVASFQGLGVSIQRLPGHDDDFMDEIAKAADACRPGTNVAREGLVLRP